MMRFSSYFHFLLSVVKYTLLLIGILVGINLYLDIYGLFRSVEGRNIPVYHTERISKYLLTYKYIPQNFNTVVLGTSLSDNLDFSAVNDSSAGFKIYNASIMGANISELTPLAVNLLKHGVRRYVVCLSPYLTKNSGAKEVSLDKKLYYGALGSKNLYETYAIGLIRHFNLLPQKFPKNQISQNGANDYAKLFAVGDVRKRINREVMENNDPIYIDSNALQSLHSLITMFRKNDAEVLFYFHPVPYDVFISREKQFLNFQRTIRDILGNENEILEFNSREFKNFTQDDLNYIDHAHLSKKGQSIISDTLLSHMLHR